MKRVIKNNYKIIIGILIGILLSVTTVYAIEAYIESNKVLYDNHNEATTTKDNVQESIDELYERSGIHKEKWVDPILNGADPVLKDPLIPVEITDDGDVYYANENSEWYNYKKKKWANAVILVDEPTKEYTVGAKIEEDDIESYFVWIPRYQYKVWDLGKYTKTITLKDLTDTADTSQSENALWKITGNNTRIIDIKFGTYETYPKMTEPTSTGVYYTHPAFTLGNKDLNGIWVGKFETGGTIDSLVVKPNVISLRNNTIKAFFDAGYDYERDLDSHMMKNTEWGAIAYLSHSVYGKGTQVNINNTSDFYTGYSATSNIDQSTLPNESAAHDVEAKTQPWDTPTGYLASTTGNINGIYDMSGGAWENVAACMEDNPRSSEFDEATLTKEMNDGYIDKYSKDSTVNLYNKRILGDATGEMGPFYGYYEGNGTSPRHTSWYDDKANFIDPTYSWFLRSGGRTEGAVAGQFFFASVDGGATGDRGFRISLAIK